MDVRGKDRLGKEERGQDLYFAGSILPYSLYVSVVDAWQTLHGRQLSGIMPLGLTACS
jgi:hypothetical protein